MRFIFASVIAYFIGNISSAYLAGRCFGNIDIREHGSGNAGATNTLRVLGLKPALLTLAGDILKGVVAVLIGRYLGGLQGELLGAAFVIVGQIWPVLLGFHGGKGVATALGAMMTVQPAVTAVCALIALAIMALTKYVSLGSILGVTLFGIVLIVMKTPVEMKLFAVFVVGLIVFAHRTNIKRLLTGTEKKLGQKEK